MQNHRHEFRITLMARVLGVSRSGFYEWCALAPRRAERLQRRCALDQRVRDLYLQSKQRDGAPRLSRELRRLYGPVNRKTVALSLRRQHLRAKAGRRFKATTNSRHHLPVHPNRLQQDFSASAPNRKWCGDITYLWTDQGWVYLATVIDLFSRKVVGWAMDQRMTASLVCDALKMALLNRGLPRGVIFHTDRGSQYCSHEMRDLLCKHGIIGSMSAKGNCYDNACAESFFHSLKVEAVHGEHFETRDQLRAAIFEYIEVDYNRTRLHSALGYLSPVQFEAQQAA